MIVFFLVTGFKLEPARPGRPARTTGPERSSDGRTDKSDSKGRQRRSVRPMEKRNFFDKHNF